MNKQRQKELGDKLQVLLMELSKASVNIEKMAHENGIDELTELMEKCENEIEHPVQAVIDSIRASVKNNGIPTYEEARKIIAPLKLKSMEEYREFVRANPHLNLPLHPDKYYS